MPFCRSSDLTPQILRKRAGPGSDEVAIPVSFPKHQRQVIAVLLSLFSTIVFHIQVAVSSCYTGYLKGDVTFYLNRFWERITRAAKSIYSHVERCNECISADVFLLYPMHLLFTFQFKNHCTMRVVRDRK